MTRTPSVPASTLKQVAMTNKRAAQLFSSIAPFLVLVLTITAALEASAQQTGAGRYASKTSAALPPVSFAPIVPYLSGGQGATSVAVADVNGDGHPDLVVGNATGVDVLLGNGDGTFQIPVSYPLPNANAASSVAIADLNGDGHPDVAVASRYSDSVFVLMNKGDGTFKSPRLYNSGGAFGTSVAIADLNGDGHQDLVVANICQYMSDCWRAVVGVLLGNGDGTFQPAIVYATGGYWADSVAIADVNGDGYPDLVVATLDPGAVGVLLGNGDGTFQSPSGYGAGGSQAFSVAIGDFNGDGHPDLAVANESGIYGGVGVLLGNGDGTFQPAVNYSSGGDGGAWVALGDLNGDGNLDVAVMNDNVPGTSPVAVLLGVGNGTFAPAQLFQTPAYYGSATAIADLNGDGKPDIVTLDYCQKNCNGAGFQGVIGIFLNNSLTNTTTALTSSLNPSTYGQSVTWTAAVTSYGSIIPTGTVVFSWSGNILGSATLNSSGVATLTRSNLNADTFPVMAAYKGDANNAASNSAIIDQVVEQAITSATLTSSPNPSNLSQAVTFTANIACATTTPAGPVTFTAGNTVLGTVELKNGKATLTTSSLSAGSTEVTVTYSGDSDIKGSAASVTQVVGQGSGSTTTALTYSANNSTFNETFTAKVTSASGTPTGTVVFIVGKTTLGSVTLSSGQATLTVPTLSVGSNTVTATYNGNSQFTSSSAWITQTFVMPVTGMLYLQQQGGSAAATTTFGTGTSPSNFVGYYTGLPNNPNPTGQLLVGTFTAGTLVNFGMYTTFVGQSGYSFSTGTDQASLVSFADLSNSLGLNHGITQQTSSTTWLLHLDDALSYLYDDDNNDVLMELIVVPSNQQSSGHELWNRDLVKELNTTSLPTGSDTITVTYTGDSNIQGSSASITQVVQ